jgi:Uma2 family endonuclease
MGFALRKTEEELTLDDYLEIERASEFRNDYVNGQIIAMSGESLSHGRIKGNVYHEIRNHLRGKPCEAFTSDMKVKVEGVSPFKYPDVVVVCGQPQMHDAKKDLLLNPLVIIEVLSPSTEAVDRGEKFDLYQAIPSLKYYVLIAQDRSSVTVMTRQSNNRWELELITDMNASLLVPDLDCEIPLHEIYDRVEFPVPKPTLVNGQKSRAKKQKRTSTK